MQYFDGWKWHFNLLLIGMVLVFIHSHSGNCVFRRLKRDVPNLAFMIIQELNINPLSINNYGSYCGMSGGGKPVDSIDGCCMLHDQCYIAAVNDTGPCSSFGRWSPYWTGYKWEITNGNVTCHPLKSKPRQAPCALYVCGCDVALTRCLRTALKSYKVENKHKFWWKRIVFEYLSTVATSKT